VNQNGFDALAHPASPDLKWNHQASADQTEAFFVNDNRHPTDMNRPKSPPTGMVLTGLPMAGNDLKKRASFDRQWSAT
jgi:hypothetical protein